MTICDGEISCRQESPFTLPSISATASLCTQRNLGVHTSENIIGAGGRLYSGFQIMYNYNYWSISAISQQRCFAREKNMEPQNGQTKTKVLREFILERSLNVELQLLEYKPHFIINVLYTGEHNNKPYRTVRVRRRYYESSYLQFHIV